MLCQTSVLSRNLRGLFTSICKKLFVIVSFLKQRLFTHSSTENQVTEEEPEPELLHPHLGVYPLNRFLIVLTL